MSLPVDIYVRVSRRAGRADERFHSPEEQEQIARAYAKARRLKVGVVLTPDIDRSGGTVQREGLQQALARLRAGQSQGIVVAWIDRFSRDAAQAYDLLREFDDAGGRVFAPEAPEDVSSPEGELQLGMFLLIAQYQRKRSRAGFARAKERAILAGIPVGPTPFGYRQRGERADGTVDRTLEPDPETAPVVQELFEMRARGAGATAMADLLTESTGRTWSREGAKALIRNRIYATGRLAYGDVVSDVEAGALVDEPLWHAAQITTPPRRARDPEAGWLLTGLLRCAACGHSLTPTKSSAQQNGGTRYRYYRCRNRACTARAGVSALRIEPWVVLQSMAVGDQLQTRATAPDLAGLEEALATAERRYEQAKSPEVRDALGDDWPADVKARRLERDTAAAALGSARTTAGVSASEFRLREVWADLSPGDRRAALHLFWKAIRVGRKGTDGTPITLVARGPHAEVDVALPEADVDAR